MNSLVIGIAGGSSSGKTTVTHRVASALGEENVALLHHDDYYKDITRFDGKDPSEINFDHPDAFDNDLFVDHVHALRTGKAVQRPVYNYSTYRRTAEVRMVVPRTILIVEGILIFVDRRLRELLDIKVYVDTDNDERVLRRIQRDVLERQRTIESVMHQYVATVKPMHLEFVEPSKRWADIIIPRGGENTIAIDMVVTKLRSMLRVPD